MTEPMTDEELEQVSSYLDATTEYGPRSVGNHNTIGRLLGEVQRLRGEVDEWRHVGGQANQGMKDAIAELEARNNEIGRMGREIAKANEAFAAVRAAFEVENRPVYDFPLGFEVMGQTRDDQHHADCSQRAGMLCDCAALAASGVTWVTAWRRAAETVDRVLNAASGSPQGAAQGAAPGPETPDTHSGEGTGVSERHGSDQASKSHWLKWDSGVRNIVGCQCGFAADVDSDAGFGDSVVHHLIDVGRSLPAPSRGEGT